MRSRSDIKATVYTYGMLLTIMDMEEALLQPTTPSQAELVPVNIVPFTMPGSNDLAGKVVEDLGQDGRAVLLKTMA